MNEIYMTVQGNLASDVKYRITPGGVPVAQFRVASSASRPDGSGQWRETGKAYFEVTCWRRAADNARASLAKGLPVVIHARLRQRQVSRTVQGAPEASYEQTYNDLEAVGFGLDLSRCRSRFERSPVGPQLAVSDWAREEVPQDPAAQAAGEDPAVTGSVPTAISLGSPTADIPDSERGHAHGPGRDRPAGEGAPDDRAPAEFDLPGVA